MKRLQFIGDWFELRHRDPPPCPSLPGILHFLTLSVMSDRLSELRRQRVLAQEQLAWLDREIAREAASTPSTGPVARPAPAPVGVPSPAAATADPSMVIKDPDAILEEYRVPPGAVHQNVKKGCLLYFAAAFVVLGLGLAALYFLTGRR